ncbi:Gx transporter family protein [Salinispira pacifica]|uniref:Heptaprenyl diphosphate synthase component I n=1 Tax=Salinispira pacifica TaxID=1307761 RepID=V5WFW9_9SPIO|nr:Gx transporter family protein [Salinispira pacifica]AHC14732.1 hypothetical protein L21SP2_1333 [Salinispira pacifica]
MKGDQSPAGGSPQGSGSGGSLPHGLPQGLIKGEAERTRRLKYIAMFAAFSMFAATLEYLFPRPVPFFRLGLANLPILLAFPLLDLPGLLMLTLLKVLGQGLVNGTLASYVFLLSLTGSFASFFLMYGLYRLLPGRLSYLGLSLAGALASNTVQSLFSVLVIFGQQAWVILPLFYGLGFAAGVVIGALAEVVSRRSRWFYLQYVRLGADQNELAGRSVHSSPSIPADSPEEEEGKIPDLSEYDERQSSETPRRRRRRAPLQRLLSTNAAFIAGLSVLPIYLLTTDPAARFIQVLILGILTRMAGKRLLYTYFIFLLASVTFFHALVPQGRVLTYIGGFAVTRGALLSGLGRGLTIIGFVFISLFSIRRDLKIPGTLGKLISATLRFFEHIYEFRKKARIGGLVARLDRVLFELSALPFQEDGEAAEARPGRQAEDSPASESPAASGPSASSGPSPWIQAAIIVMIDLLIALPLVFSDFLLF